MAHRTFLMFAHITWHTWNRVACVDARAANDVRVAVLTAGKRTGVRVIKGEVLADHVHLLVSFRPDTRISDFMRFAKSISATRANRQVVGSVKWARGYYIATRARPHIRPNVYHHHPNPIPRSCGIKTPGASPG